MAHAMLRGASTVRIRTLRPVMALRLPLAASRAAYSTNTNTPQPQAPLPMPENMPREDYAAPTAYVLGTLGTVVKYLLLTAAGLGVTAAVAYEGLHMYVEHVSLAAPSRAVDGYGWEEDNLPFTGGARGGTDARLGVKGRHALRGAYLAWEHGAGDAAAIQKRAVHPELKGVGMMSYVDRGYEVAEEYLDVAIAAAEAQGIVFPRASPFEPAPTGPVDPTALDLLRLKAGILERMNTPETRAHAQELYERILAALPEAEGEAGGNAVSVARGVRLAHKIGDLALRAGERDEAERWWADGLRRAGIEVDGPAAVPGMTPPRPVAAGKRSWWWPFGGRVAPTSTVVQGTSTPTSTPTPASDVAVDVDVLAPPVRRAATNILISAAAAAAQSGDLARAATLQDTAFSVLPAPAWVNGKLAVSVPSATTAPATLQATWEAARVALLELHRASVQHAQRAGDAQPLAAQAADHAEAVLAHLTPRIPAAYTARGAPTAQPAERLLRDTLSTAAEAQYTSAILLERTAAWAQNEDRIHRLEHASEAFERAMSLAASESGTTDARHLGDKDAVGRSPEWVRFYKGYVRTREKIMKIVAEGEDK